MIETCYVADTTLGGLQLLLSKTNGTYDTKIRCHFVIVVGLP